MPDIYVCGHGGWSVIGASSIFFTVPAGTTVFLYKQVGEVLYVSEAEKILRRNAQSLAPARTVNAYEQCPDLTLYPAREFWSDFGAAAAQGGAFWHAVASQTKLSHFIQYHPHSRIHWIACEVRGLRK